MGSEYSSIKLEFYSFTFIRSMNVQHCYKAGFCRSCIMQGIALTTANRRDSSTLLHIIIEPNESQPVPLMGQLLPAA